MQQQSPRQQKQTQNLPPPQSPMQRAMGSFRGFIKELIELDQTDQLNQQHARERRLGSVNVHEIQSTSDRGLLLKR